MTRIPILQEDDPLFPMTAGNSWCSRARSAERRNIYRSRANRPEAGRALSQLIRAVYRADSSVPQKDAELAYLTATVVNNCYY